MNIENFDEQLEMLSTIGYTFNIDEKMKLKMARITLLNSNPNFDQIKLWGKIQAITKTYYILVALQYNNSYQFPHKTFFWATNDFQFTQLPQLLLQHKSFAQKYNSQYFSGDSAKILKNLQGQGGEEGGEPPAQQNNENQQEGNKKIEQEEQDQDIKKAPKKNFTQLNRLSYVVRAIQNQAQIIPRDSYRISPEHELHLNDKFYGLTLENALSYSYWLHFRAPQTESARDNINQDHVVFNSNFLDNLQSDKPKGVWSLQLDHKKKNISVRNLSWPGYFAFHRLSSSVFGSIYIGQGIKNAELPFMV